MTSTSRSWSIIAGLAVAGLVTGCGASGGPATRTAEAEAHARDTAAQIFADQQSRRRPRVRTADAIGRALSARSEADLVAISGVDTAHPGGVTAVLRIVGQGTDGSWLEPETVVEHFCFEMRFALASPAPPAAVPCPSPAARLTFPPPAEPKLPSPDELRAALAATAADETRVREALAGLSLDPTVRIDVATRDGMVGVALRPPMRENGQYECVFARVRAGTVDAWQPAAIQLQPGELACLAEESLAGYGSQPPR